MMKPASVKELKDELKHRSPRELLEIVLRLSRFKKENKELLTYLLFSAADEEGYIEAVKQEMDEQFQEINRSSYYFMKKSMRKILRNVKKFSRYSGKKETETELLIYYLQKMDSFSPSIHRNKTLQNLFDRQLALVKKNIPKLHEDLQYDLNLELEKLSRE
ncbi:hypothetical protein SAMN04488034_101247 [Salinimicrobium catena]|uniref:Uncharacterized protein n=2 Tax=Salinimicrobium catena TaxID=390640 RepID=A0A1H5HU28_9FLAO|nr:hypothetical protein SAMN04488140_101247 [Salinimicrobium catena]SEE31493.1 hypothetical protein SAMN04488034_101247 [Salinimicrobium catena]